MRPLLALFSCLVLAACVQNPPKSTMRVCDSDGCSQRPTDSASHDPSEAVPDEDPEDRLDALQALAREDPRAAYDLGLRYFRGDGVRQNSYKALQWMRDAGERGNLDAQKALGRLYLTGLQEMGSDPGEAQRWLSMAAAQGDKASKALLARANEARQGEMADYEWRQRYRERVRYYWYHRAHYHWRWHHGRWWHHGY